MYKINDLVVYGKTGVCRITDIAVPENSQMKKDQLYYVLQPLYESCTIYTPVDTKVFMRPVISAKEADRLIDSIPAMRADAYYNDRLQELVQHYEDALKDQDCACLLELTMSIYAKKKYLQQNSQKFGQTDERYLKQAEHLLCSEFSLALEIPKEDVPAYIEARVEALHLQTE
jgi:CarD family transcriptional regulator